MEISSTVINLCIIGHPVSHSLSPVIHKTALKHFGLMGDYSLLDVHPNRLQEHLLELAHKRYKGFSVTIPHKQKIIPLLSELTPQAKQIGAVNTVLIQKSGEMLGHNTDLDGFIQALNEFEPNDLLHDTALVIGAGGAARSAIWGLSQLGWQNIYIITRNIDAAKQIVDEIKSPTNIVILPLGNSYPNLKVKPSLLVNCTPLGLNEDNFPPHFNKFFEILDKNALVFDMVYKQNNEETPFVRQAKVHNINACDGIAMLVHQAALSFKFWTGITPPTEILFEAIRKNRKETSKCSGMAP